MGLGSSTQYKVRMCFQCQGTTGFYCNTCNQDLCLQCKERHVIALLSKHHDVVIYREKYKCIQKRKTCARHPDNMYVEYCDSCELPACFQCTEHRNHKILDIKRAYEENRQQFRVNIQKIRSDTIYNNCFHLTGIKTDIKTCQTEISKHQSKMSTKAQRLNNIIDTVICDVKARYKYLCITRLQQLIRKMSRHLASIENYEDSFEQSANRPVKFLLFLKKTRLPKTKDTPNLLQHITLSLTEETNIEVLVKLLIEIRIIETGKRQVRNECVLKLMSTPVLHKSFNMMHVSGVTHISFITSDRICICDGRGLIFANTTGDKFVHMTFLSVVSYHWSENQSPTQSYGVHTVNIKGEVIYIDYYGNIRKLLNDETDSLVIKNTDEWEPHCIYCSIANEDLLLGTYNIDSWESKVMRYNKKGQHLQTIKHNETGQELYRAPIYITENRNGDIIVSDLWCGVVVTDRGGRHRFTYTGCPSEPRLLPYGICTDALSNILVSDEYTRTVHMIDKDGNFLSQIHTQHQMKPCGLGLDYNTNLLWVGSKDSDILYVYRYITRRDYITAKDKTDALKRPKTGGGPAKAPLTAAEECLLQAFDGHPNIVGLTQGIDSDGGHMGVRRTLDKMNKSQYCWPHLRKSVHDYVTSCDICKERKHPSKKKRSYMKTYLSGVKFERIAVDIAGPFPKTNNGFVYILVIADYFTKFTEIFPLRDIEAETVANIFRGWIKRYGCPQELHSDQGVQLESQIFQEL
ncbi:uncharacterized protein LOC133180675 [Saccostrea echinata]|uniref:uncharacterized protein LOC133180675 n=1 Tax=Saccostrea echinata TaxID=191078 RepID=UPI002A81C2A8|nr:uncharacterized protein LOC133180675 [Saccostrea echinata]